MDEFEGLECLSALNKIEKELNTAEAKSEARLILRQVTGRDMADILSGGYSLTGSQSAIITETIKRRKAGEPLQYILGRAWFMGLALSPARVSLYPGSIPKHWCRKPSKKQGRAVRF